MARIQDHIDGADRHLEFFKVDEISQVIEQHSSSTHHQPVDHSFTHITLFVLQHYLASVAWTEVLTSRTCYLGQDGSFEHIFLGRFYVPGQKSEVITPANVLRPCPGNTEKFLDSIYLQHIMGLHGSETQEWHQHVAVS